MSVQPEEIIQNEFLVDVATPAAVTPDQNESHLLGISIGVAAAFLAWRYIVKERLQKEAPRTPQEAANVTLKVIKELSKVWDELSIAPISQAYSTVPYKHATKLAIDYATELGQYVNDTSVSALLEGFTSQVNAGWGEGISWTRATEGYGLDPRQMKSYVSSLLVAEKPRYGDPPIPPNVQASLERAVLTRADRLGQNEAHKAVQVGKNMVWMAMSAQGDLPPGTMKKWVTAEDERVCVVCGPLDQVTIPLTRRFKAPNGDRFYAPGVHPNCRCELEMIYPDLGYDVVKAMATATGEYDEYDRNEKGQFAEQESRTAITLKSKKDSQRSVVTLKGKGGVSLKAKEAVTLKAKDAVALKSKYEEIAEEVADAVEDDELPSKWPAGRPGFYYDTEVLVPGWQVFTKGPGMNDYEDLRRLLLDEANEGMTISVDRKRGFTLDKEFAYGGIPPYQTIPFWQAYDNEVANGLADVYKFNAQADQASGGRASLSRIAPTESGKYANSIRSALTGLNKKQLLYIIEETFNDAQDDAITREFISPERGNDLSSEEIIAYWEKQDVNDVASAILFASLEEEDERIGGSGVADWKASMSRLFDIHNKGRHYKRRHFRGAGAPDYRTGTPIIFRIANGWAGKPLGDSGAAEVTQKYRVANTTVLPAPGASKSMRPESEYANSILVVDLIPLYETEIDRPGLDLTVY